MIIYHCPDCNAAYYDRGVAWSCTCGKEINRDDAAVDRFAEMMKRKLAQAREKGRGGWQFCSESVLLPMLHEHVAKGDMRDVANLAMMIHLNRKDSE